MASLLGKPLKIVSTGGDTSGVQFRLGYSAGVQADFSISSGGDLTIAPSGGDTNVTGNLAVSGGLTLGTNLPYSELNLGGNIVNADISASAEIAVSKLADGTARQLLQTDAAGTGVEWTSNVDVPGTLDVTGATALDSTLTVAGDVSIADKIIHTGDTNTAIRFPAADTVTVETAGSERLRVDSDGHLTVGATPVGVTSLFSIKALQVGDVSLLTGGLGDTNLSNNQYFDGSNVRYIKSDGASYIYQAQGSIRLHTVGSGTAGAVVSIPERMRIDSSGNVLVGTTSADSNAKLTVNGGGVVSNLYFNGSGISANGAAITKVTGSPYSLIISATNSSSAAGPIIFESRRNVGAGTGVETMRIDSSGNVGIGVTPSAWNGGRAIEINKLGTAIWGADNNNVWFLSNAYYDSSANFKYANSGAAATAYQQVNAQHRWLTAPSGTAGNTISFSEKARIDSDGLKFNGDTAAANALDDYEEGTWTPTTVTNGFTQTISSMSGEYTKIGRQVYFRVQINLSSAGYPSSYCNFSGLPFAVGGGVHVCSYHSNEISTADSWGLGYITSSNFLLNTSVGTGTVATWHVSGVYTVA